MFRGYKWCRVAMTAMLAPVFKRCLRGMASVFVLFGSGSMMMFWYCCPDHFVVRDVRKHESFGRLLHRFLRLVCGWLCGYRQQTVVIVQYGKYSTASRITSPSIHHSCCACHRPVTPFITTSIGGTKYKLVTLSNTAWLGHSFRKRCLVSTVVVVVVISSTLGR